MSELLGKGWQTVIRISQGGKAGQIIHTHVYLNGREMALAVNDDQMSALRTTGAL